MSPDEQTKIRTDLNTWLMDAIAAYQNDTPRTKQLRIGPSELGSCRRLLQGKITGEVSPAGAPAPGVKWAAFVGTAVGDLIETAVSNYGGAQTQVEITCVMPSGINVTGSCDILLPNRKGVADLKGKDGIEAVQREGASLEHLIQISAYLEGAWQGGLVDVDALGHLIYYDRSGKDTQVFVVTVTLDEARGWIEKADERIEDVTNAIARGEDAPRDWDESKCFYWACPLHDICWAGTAPEGEITDEDKIAAIKLYDEGRAMKKEAERLIQNAKERLGAWEEEPVSGTIAGYSLAWKLRAGPQGTVNRQIDLRRLKE